MGAEGLTRRETIPDLTWSTLRFEPMLETKNDEKKVHKEMMSMEDEKMRILAST